MTIPEACQLVLQAAVMAEVGQTCVLDMDEPVKIVDLAISRCGCSACARPARRDAGRLVVALKEIVLDYSPSRHLLKRVIDPRARHAAATAVH